MSATFDVRLIAPCGRGGDQRRFTGVRSIGCDQTIGREVILRLSADPHGLLVRAAVGVVVVPGGGRRRPLGAVGPVVQAESVGA